MKNGILISIGNIIKGKQSHKGQTATLWTLVIAIILLFVAASINLGRVAHSENKMSVAADAAALGLASTIGSYAHMLSESYLHGKDYESKTEWGLIFTIILAIIAIIVTFYTGGSTAPATWQIVMLCFSLAATAYQQFYMIPNALNAMSDEFARLGEDQRMRETGINIGLQSIMDDPEEFEDLKDIDKDGVPLPLGGQKDFVSRFLYWYKQRLTMLHKLNNYVNEEIAYSWSNVSDLDYNTLYTGTHGYDSEGNPLSYRGMYTFDDIRSAAWTFTNTRKLLEGYTPSVGFHHRGIVETSDLLFEIEDFVCADYGENVDFPADTSGEKWVPNISDTNPGMSLAYWAHVAEFGYAGINPVSYSFLSDAGIRDYRNDGSFDPDLPLDFDFFDTKNNPAYNVALPEYYSESFEGEEIKELPATLENMTAACETFKEWFRPHYVGFIKKRLPDPPYNALYAVEFGEVLVPDPEYHGDAFPIGWREPIEGAIWPDGYLYWEHPELDVTIIRNAMHVWQPGLMTHIQLFNQWRNPIDQAWMPKLDLLYNNTRAAWQVLYDTIQKDGELSSEIARLEAEGLTEKEYYDRLIEIRSYISRLVYLPADVHSPDYDENDPGGPLFEAKERVKDGLRGAFRVGEYFINPGVLAETGVLPSWETLNEIAENLAGLNDLLNKFSHYGAYAYKTEDGCWHIRMADVNWESDKYGTNEFHEGRVPWIEVWRAGLKRKAALREKKGRVTIGIYSWDEPREEVDEKTDFTWWNFRWGKGDSGEARLTSQESAMIAMLESLDTQGPWGRSGPDGMISVYELYGDFNPENDMPRQRREYFLNFFANHGTSAEATAKYDWKSAERGGLPALIGTK